MFWCVLVSRLGRSSVWPLLRRGHHFPTKDFVKRNRDASMLLTRPPDYLCTFLIKKYFYKMSMKEFPKHKRTMGKHFNWLEPCKRGVRFTHYSPLSSVYTCPFWHSWTVTSHHFDTAVTPPAPRASQSRERTAERATHTLKKNFGQFTSPSYYQTNQQPAILIYRRQSCEMCKEYSALKKWKR